MEPRVSVIGKRTKNIQNITAVVSGKGGVGKSLVASTLSLILAEKGKKVGLLDLDLYGPSSHIILGVTPRGFPKENRGILPFDVENMKYMSIVYFTDDKPSAFRGMDITNIIIEILAITQWKNLDYLIIDMPPGTGDEVLDVISFVPKTKFLTITTPSRVAMGAVEKMLKILLETNTPMYGVVENMKRNESSYVEDVLNLMNIPYLGSLCFDESIEDMIGLPQQLLTTDFAHNLQSVLLPIMM